jgi:hypothetical protein
MTSNVACVLPLTIPGMSIECGGSPAENLYHIDDTGPCPVVANGPGTGAASTIRVAVTDDPDVPGFPDFDIMVSVGLVGLGVDTYSLARSCADPEPPLSTAPITLDAVAASGSDWRLTFDFTRTDAPPSVTASDIELVPL